MDGLGIATLRPTPLGISHFQDPASCCHPLALPGNINSVRGQLGDFLEFLWFPSTVGSSSSKCFGCLPSRSQQQMQMKSYRAPIGKWSSNHFFSGAVLNFGGVCLCVFKALQIWSCFLPLLTSFFNSDSVVSRLLIKDRCFRFICADASGVFWNTHFI